MQFAADPNEFGLVVFDGEGWCAGRLRAVPLLVVASYGVNGVSDGIIVLHPDLLIDAQGEDVRRIAAAALVESDDGTARGFVRSAGGDIDDDVLEAVVGARDNAFGHRRRAVELGAI